MAALELGGRGRGEGRGVLQIEQGDGIWETVSWLYIQGPVWFVFLTCHGILSRKAHFKDAALCLKYTLWLFVVGYV